MEMNNQMNEKMKAKIKERLHEYCDCSYDTCYALVLLARNKENVGLTERHKIERTSRFLFSQGTEIDSTVDALYAKAESLGDIKFRVYVSVNRRSLKKGLRAIQNKLVEISSGLIDGNFECYATLANFHSEIKSIYCEKGCRAERRFLFDVDYDNKSIEGQNAFLDLINRIKTVEQNGKPVEIFCSLATRNGFAIVTSPFDYKKHFKSLPDVEVKSDNYLLVGMLNDPDYKF